MSQLVKWESFLANCNWKIILLLWSFHLLKYIQVIAVHFCYLSVSMCTMIGQFSVPSFHNTVCLNWNLPPLIEPRVKTNISVNNLIFVVCTISFKIYFYPAWINGPLEVWATKNYVDSIAYSTDFKLSQYEVCILLLLHWLTLYTLTSEYIFSLLFSIHFL